MPCIEAAVNLGFLKHLTLDTCKQKTVLSPEQEQQSLTDKPLVQASLMAMALGLCQALLGPVKALPTTITLQAGGSGSLG